MTSERGVAGVASLSVDVHRAIDYEVVARRRLPAAVYEYIAGGSGDGTTLTANRAAFERETICPRLLRDLTTASTRVTFAGREWTHPIMLAPVAHHALVHPRAEIETARGAAASDACMVASTLSSCTLEDIGAAAPGPKWFQLYVQPRRADTLDLVRRAEACGYSAIVLTLDAAIQLPSVRALEAGFTMPAHCVAANLRGYAPSEPAEGVGSRIFAALRNAPTWADLEWLVAQTSLPVWVKGVLHPDDARQLRDRGIAGLVVSNHGGRTLDHAPASLTVLPSIREAVGPDHPLLLDSGVRCGADIYKALVLGADAVLVGRLQLYALAVAGALGVAHMLRLLREELEVCMAMTGCTSLGELRRDRAASVDPC